jgi:hypothetical protein
MPTYTIELTAEQLKALSQMTMWAEYWKHTNGHGLLEGVEVEVMFKVSDQLQRYYDDNGIVD